MTSPSELLQRLELERVVTAMQDPKAVFVFGSNLAGRHGRGAALTALQQYGARYGYGVGLHGRSYAVPTKDGQLRTLPLTLIKQEIRELFAVAREHDDRRFIGTRLGCGLAGYSDHQIAPFFDHAPTNYELPLQWRSLVYHAGEEIIAQLRGASCDVVVLESEYSRLYVQHQSGDCEWIPRPIVKL